MKAQSTGPLLSTVFVDYDNIYLSLKRKSEEAAKRFAKDAASWLREIESGRLITPTNGISMNVPRRIVMNRCYGNPVPRRNSLDNSTDMNSFPFVRHHFLRSGFEVIDCPPLTAQLKNSSDIRMVMDVRDYLQHDTYFDEFIILSGDADFTPLLHRLRAHARRTVIFANDHTAAPYTAISDGEVRESDLIALLLESRLPGQGEELPSPSPAVPTKAQIESARKEIVAEVTAAVKAAGQPVPLEALADRAVRTLGHDKTVGSAWGGAGSFRELLQKGLPEPMRLSDTAPYHVFDATRAAPPEPVRAPSAEPTFERVGLPPPPPPMPPFVQTASSAGTSSQKAPAQRALGPAAFSSAVPNAPAPQLPARQSFAAAAQAEQAGEQMAIAPPAAPAARVAGSQAPTQRTSEGATSLQQSIARIHEACQAPPLSPPEYRALFDIMAQEINTKGLSGAQTISNISQRAQELGIDLRRDDVRFVLEVVSEADPWFEQGASANLFAGRFRNFVVARCRSHGLNLSAEELDLIEAWFAGAGAGARSAASGNSRMQTQPAATSLQAATPPPAEPPRANERWWNLDESRALANDQIAADRVITDGDYEEEFPRIVRTRLRG